MTPRLATIADQSGLLILIHVCISHMKKQGIEQWDEIYPNAEIVTRDVAVGSLYVLEEQSEIIACITIDRMLDPLWNNLDWSPNMLPAVAVHRLMVHPSRQGKGIAKQLMSFAEELARKQDARSIRLDAFTANPAALALYERLGYRRTGTAMMRKGPFIGFEKIL